MNKFFAWAFLLLCITGACGQTFTTKDLLTDLNYLNEVVEKGHTSNLNPAFNNKIPALIDRISASGKTVYTFIEFDQAIRTALAETGCFHTVVYPAKLPVIKIKNPFFPYKVWTDGQGLYALAKTSDSRAIPELEFPARIFSVNGQPVGRFLPDLLLFQAADGPQKTRGIQLFNDFGTIMLRQYFEKDSVFTVFTHEKEIIAPAVPKISFHGFKIEQPPWIRQPAIADRGPVKLHEIDGAPNSLYLLFNHFKYGDGKAVHRQILDEILSRGTENLILDLRDNGGGKTKNAVGLLRYFLKEEFTSSDIVPGFKRGKYLKFSMARLGLGIWETANVFIRQKQNQGRKYVHRYRPRNTIYNGRIYLLVNGDTGSTSTLLAAYLKHKTDKTTLIGEETGGGETGSNAGSFSSVRLPVSRIKIRFPLVRIQHDLGISDHHRGIKPDLVVRYSPADILTGIDLELEKAIQLISTPPGN